MVDELLSVVMAGQEPPSVAVTCVLDRLAREATVRDRFLAAGAEKPYRDAVVREEMRLHPPALAALRRLTAPLDVAGRTLPLPTPGERWYGAASPETRGTAPKPRRRSSSCGADYPTRRDPCAPPSAVGRLRATP